ncbi:MAG TPA: ABC transporter permease, partial [Devosia sp.]|nr:ABC transporter permease [Devosia sp.]
MQLRLERRPEPSRLLQFVTPIGAVLLTMGLGAIVFTLLGYDGLGAVREIFISPLANSYKWQDLAVKAAPLIIIAVGLSISYRANVWNIGAEGQYIVGAIAGTGVGILTNDMTGWWIMPLMMLAGAAGGAAYAAIPAFLRVRLSVNEILTTLMLTYASVYLLNYLL